ncbi:DUF2314 domain-containing protein [Hymenobacter setariae]|uniref:DUF2314 domain-containing protein n=1 Tax=Hymenobacter setariae TaxID=2594794 RepID=A0A558BUK3_9BACT|nr:DUF2314 domain-containing protein [Hymenobacter setariae]TVT40169.1 DUF2314 domain-containing protein [Hymenobacter setariae]
MKCLILPSLVVGLLLALPAAAQKKTSASKEATLAPNAPVDRPVSVAAPEQEAAAALAAFERHIAPAVQQARATLPQAKRRYLKGLPDGQIFFVTTRISDSEGLFEQVFVRVRQWQGSQVSGEIASELNNIKTYRQGQLIHFPESAVFDWTISRPDGTEEGNYVGKLLDADSR